MNFIWFIFIDLDCFFFPPAGVIFSFYSLFQFSLCQKAIWFDFNQTLLSPAWTSKTILSATLQPQRNWLIIQSNRHFCSPPASCTSVFATYPSSTMEGAHLDSSCSPPALSGWLKRDGGVLLGAGMLGIPRAPTRSKQAKRSKLQLSSKQAQHPLFISAEILMHVMKGLK